MWSSNNDQPRTPNEVHQNASKPPPKGIPNATDDLPVIVPACHQDHLSYVTSSFVTQPEII
jgi:hypothetical protein